jgi:asparagine synthase (glutamine-hydrolysing)
MRVHRWWDLRLEPEERCKDEWVDRVAESVTRVVQRQMVSDVPLGGFLSGGVDSSAIVAAMAAAGEPVSTYTIGFDREDLRHEIVPDDLRHARDVASRFRTRASDRILGPRRARPAATGGVASRGAGR